MGLCRGATRLIKRDPRSSVYGSHSQLSYQADACDIYIVWQGTREYNCPKPREGHRSCPFPGTKIPCLFGAADLIKESLAMNSKIEQSLQGARSVKH